MKTTFEHIARTKLGENISELQPFQVSIMCIM